MIGVDRDDRRLILSVAMFVVLMIVIGGVWPWLIR